jgi:hypothetical protein
MTISLFSATQPVFLPPLYMMERAARSHDMVYMMEAQYSKLGHHNRAYFVTPDAEHHLLSLPVSKPNGWPSLNEIELIRDVRVPSKMLKFLRQTYKKSSYFGESEEMIDAIENFHSRSSSLADFNRQMFEYLILLLKLRVRTHMAHELVGQYRKDDWTATDWVCRMGEEVEATDYLCGRVATEQYWEFQISAEYGYQVWYQQYDMPKLAHPYDSSLSVDSGSLSTVGLICLYGADVVRGLIDQAAGPGFSNTTVGF